MAAKKQVKKTPEVQEPDLDDKELVFCIEYSVSNNARQAYQKAYKCGYNTAKSAGCLLLQNATIKSAIRDMRVDRNERLKIDADDVLRKLKILSEYDASEFYDDDGRLKPLRELHPDLRYCIEGMDVSEQITGDDGDGISRLMKIKLPKKQAALEALGRHLLLFGDKAKENPVDSTAEYRAISEAMARTQTSTSN